MFENRNPKLIFITLISVILMGFSLSLLNIVDWGTDPFSFMNLSISSRLGLSFGNWQIILNVLMFIPVIIFGRRQIGIGTIFNMALVGYTVDFCAWIWEKTGFVTLIDSTLSRAILMIPSLSLFVFVAAVYMSTDLGTAPYDALPMIISQKLPKLPFKLIRVIWDFSAIAVGALVGGKIRLVTVLMALFLGQAVAIVKKTFFPAK